MPELLEINEELQKDIIEYVKEDDQLREKLLNRKKNFSQQQRPFNEFSAALGVLKFSSTLLDEHTASNKLLLKYCDKEKFNGLIEKIKSIKQQKAAEEETRLNNLLINSTSAIDAYASAKWNTGSCKLRAYQDVQKFTPTTNEALKNKTISLLYLAAIPRRTFWTAPFGETASFKKLVKTIDENPELKRLLGYTANQTFDEAKAKGVISETDKTLKFGELTSEMSEQGKLSITAP